MATPQYNFEYDVHIGRRGHMTEKIMLENLVKDPNFDFMPWEETTTAKITDYMLVNGKGEIVDIEDIASEEPIFLYGVLLSWWENRRSYRVGNIRLVEWSFKLNHRATGYDVFVKSDVMYYRLVRPVDVYAPRMGEFQKKLGTLFWFIQEVLEGLYGCYGPQGDPALLNAYLTAAGDVVQEIKNDWDFMRSQLTRHLFIDHPCYENSLLWRKLLHRFCMADNADDADEDDREHQDDNDADNEENGGGEGGDE